MERQEIIVTDIKMPFVSMVVFMVKWVLASIPALMILGVLWAILMGLFRFTTGPGFHF